MSNYPAYLSYYLREFAGVSTATFRVPPQASATLDAHKQMSFRLPTNTLVSCKDIRLVFSASTTDNGSSKAARLPKASALIERIIVTAGGIQIDSGVQNQNALTQALDNMKVRKHDPVDSHSEMYRKVSGVNAADFGGGDGAAGNTSAEKYDSLNNATQFAVSLGNFFETVSPNLMDLSLMPEVVVTVHLAGNSVITSGKGCLAADGDDCFTKPGDAQATYTVSNYQLLVPCYSLDDGFMYQKVIQTRMADTGYLTCSWTGYDAFSDTFSGVTRCASAASSLDKIIAVFRDDGYTGRNGAIPIAGMNDGLAQSERSVSALDQSDARGMNYLSAPMNFTAPMADLPDAASALNGSAPEVRQEPELGFALNSVRYPQFNATLSQWYQLTKDAFEVPSTQSKSYMEYLSNRFVMAIRLNLPQSQALRAKSGLDLRGSNSSILLSNTSGVATKANSNVLMFLESTKELRLGAGKTLQVIL
jgi:hypothetical protein